MSDGRILVAEITVVVDDDGTEQTFYFSTSPFATGPSDTPANTPISAYLKNAGTLKLDLFSKGRLTGLVQPNYGIMTLANPLDSTGKGVFDDWGNYGVSNGKVVLRIGYENDPYPSSWTIIYIARVHKISVTDDVNITLRDRSELLDKPFVGDVFLGTGNEEGNGTSLGRKKQIVLGDPGWFPPICINTQRQIYWVGKTGVFKDGTTQRFSYPELENPFDVYDNGVKITPESDYSSFSDLYDNVPAEGYVRYYFGETSSILGSTWYNGPIYFRLGSPPAGELRTYGLGYPNDTDFNNLGFTYSSWSCEYLALRAGIESEDLDTDTKYVYVGEQLVEDDRTYLQVLSDGVVRVVGWFGFTKQDKFKSGYVLDPESTFLHYGLVIPEFPEGIPDTPANTVSLFTFTDDNIKDLRSDPVSGQETPMWAGVFNAGRTWPVSNIAGATNDVMRDNLTRDPYYTSFKAYSDTTKIKHPNAETIELEIPTRSIVNSFERNIFSARYLYLYGGTPRTYTFKTDMTDELLILELNDVVTLQTSRFGLDAGVKMRVVGMTINTNDRTMEFVLWINGRGVWTGSTSPLDPGTEPHDRDRRTRKLVDKIGKVYIPNFEILSTGGVGLGISTSDTLLVISEWDLDSSGELGEIDSEFANVTLLLHCDDTASDFIDYSRHNTDLSAADVGNITQSTSQVYAGTKSASCDGSGDYLSLLLGDHITGTGDFFCEMALYITSASADITVMDIGQYTVYRQSSDSKIVFYKSNHAAPADLESSITMSTGVWKNIALGRQSGTVYLFVQNGDTMSLEGTLSDSTNLTGFIYFGVRDSFAQPLNGYFDEVRITKICRHTSSYPVPTHPFFDENGGSICWNTFNKVGTVWTLQVDDVNSQATHYRRASCTISGSGIRNVVGYNGFRNRNSGKRYFEVLFNSGTNSLASTVVHDIGIGTANPPNSSNSIEASGAAYRKSGYIFAGGANLATVTALSSSDVVGIAIDIDTGKVWFSRNGTWVSGDPGAGTSPSVTGLTTGVNYFPGLSSDATAAIDVTIRTLHTQFSYPIPEGFKSWAMN